MYVSRIISPHEIIARLAGTKLKQEDSEFTRAVATVLTLTNI